MKGSPELKKSNSSTAAKDRKDNPVSFSEQPQKKPKLTDSQPPPGKFLTLPLIGIEPMSIAYPSNSPDCSSEDRLTIADLFVHSKSSS